MATIFTYLTLYLAGTLNFDDAFVVISRNCPHRRTYIFLCHPRRTSMHLENHWSEMYFAIFVSSSPIQGFKSNSEILRRLCPDLTAIPKTCDSYMASNS